jgi:lysophospholipase L1-like esterase
MRGDLRKEQEDRQFSFAEFQECVAQRALNRPYRFTMTKIAVVILALFQLAFAAAGAPAKPLFKFDFGNGPAAPGYTKITETTVYSEELGYGLEPGSRVVSIERSGKDPLKEDFLTSKKNEPFYFSVRVPEGNYKVTVILGDATRATNTTVKAELRRLMLTDIETSPGKFASRSFIVNVRRPEIKGDGQVRLKAREKTTEAWAWDDKLTLEFIGPRPAVCGVLISRDDKVPTIYIAGDSTSTDQPNEPYNSWGQMLTVFFKPEIAIANNGESGESLRSFIAEKRLAKIMSVIRPGDWLFIQMGHNDQKEKGPGLGAFTTYKSDLERFISEARQHGATPVLITSMNRLTFGPDGKITNSLGDYPEAVRETAKEQDVALIDLNKMSARFYEALGQERAHEAFAGNDRTHPDDYGSYELARCIVKGIEDDKLPIAKYLYSLPPFDPSQPDPVSEFKIPAEPRPAAMGRPYGN